MLLYPSSGPNDWEKILDHFIEKTNKFIFADLMYSRRQTQEFLLYIKSLKDTDILSTEYSGDFNLPIQYTNTYREISPAFFTIKILYKGIEKEIIFRRGFGQYALYELENNSLKYFCHRGDSIGESGSGVFYLGNRNLRHPPISKLFSRLVEKLSPVSYIVSDGSNTDFRKLKDFYRSISDKEANEVQSLLPIKISVKNITLKAIDVLDRRYNHTLIWEVEK